MTQELSQCLKLIIYNKLLRFYSQKYFYSLNAANRKASRCSLAAWSSNTSWRRSWQCSTITSKPHNRRRWGAFAQAISYRKIIPTMLCGFNKIILTSFGGAGTAVMYGWPPVCNKLFWLCWINNGLYFWSNPNHSNRRSANQWYFPLEACECFLFYFFIAS